MKRIDWSFIGEQVSGIVTDAIIFVVAGLMGFLYMTMQDISPMVRLYGLVCIGLEVSVAIRWIGGPNRAERALVKAAREQAKVQRLAEGQARREKNREYRRVHPGRWLAKFWLFTLPLYLLFEVAFLIIAVGFQNPFPAIVPAPLFLFAVAAPLLKLWGERRKGKQQQMEGGA